LSGAGKVATRTRVERDHDDGSRAGRVWTVHSLSTEVSMLRFLMALFVAMTLVASGGCAVNRATASADPALRWNTIKSLHVKQLQGEDGSTKTLIVQRLRAEGFDVTADPEAPARPDAYVTYVDKWMWDITMYMLELTITLREPTSDALLATGNSYHTSLSRKSPKEMVDEVVTNILKGRRAP
jgi:hypothetical protein